MVAEQSDLIDLLDVQEGDLALVGAKALHLGLMAKAGLPVSRGFVVTTSAYQRSVRHPCGTIELPQSLKEQIIAAYGEKGVRHVAVRSSATLEDLSQASFAGIYLSCLNVASEEELLRAIEACYRSLRAPAADSYRNGLSLEGCGQARMAVIVQAMVDAEAAGVMYTVDPVTLRREEFLINSVFGLAEPLVSGRVSGDLFRADRTGRVIDEKICDKRSMFTMRGEVSLPKEKRGRPSLTPEQIGALVEHGHAIESLFGSPQDIEFAIGPDGIALLQARPITIGRESLDVKVERYRQREIGTLHDRIAELREKGKLAASEAVFSGSNISELLPTPTPMSFGIFCHIFANEGGIQLGRRALGYVLGDETSDGLFELVCGQPYVNLEIDAKTFSIGIPLDIQGYIDAVKADPQRAIYPELGLYEQEWSLDDLVARFGIEAGTSYHQRFLEFLKGMVREGEAYLERFSAEVEPHFQEYLEQERDAGLTTLSNAEIADRIHAYLEHLRTFSCVHFAIAARLGFFFAERVKSRIQRFFPEEGQALVGELLRGLDGSKIARQAIDLKRMIQGTISREQFLRAYGHLASNEMEISLPRLADDPGALDRLIRDANGSLTDPVEAFREQARRRKQAESHIKGRLGQAGIDEDLLQELFEELSLAQRYLALRETIKYYFAAEYALIGRALTVLAERLNLYQSDIFNLYPAEIPELLKDRDVAKQRIEQRKEDRRLALALAKRKAMPKVIFESALEEIGRPPKFEPSREFQGIPVSSGDAVGTVRIVDPDMFFPTDQHELGANDVVVVRSANLGMFLTIRGAAGLIMETGGILAHGACLARESGVAAVVLENATALLSNGTMVRVNGSSGKVSVLAGRAS